MLPSRIDQMKVSHETGSEANFGFGRALIPSYLEMRPAQAAFFSFWIQPMFTAGVGNVDPGGPVSLQSLAPTLIKHT